jgi:outer membrane receptor protein involved in Fe transport
MKNLYLEVSAQGIGNYFVDDANKYDVPSYTVINATIGFGKAVELVSGIGLRAFMSVNNIADTKYAASAFINPDIEKSSKLPIYLEPGLPRNFVLGLTIEWK